MVFVLFAVLFEVMANLTCFRGLMSFDEEQYESDAEEETERLGLPVHFNRVASVCRMEEVEER